MAIIKIKRGTTTPTTSNLTQIGEMAINTTTNEVVYRGGIQVLLKLVEDLHCYMKEQEQYLQH